MTNNIFIFRPSPHFSAIVSQASVKGYTYENKTAKHLRTTRPSMRTSRTKTLTRPREPVSRPAEAWWLHESKTRPRILFIVLYLFNPHIHMITIEQVENIIRSNLPDNKFFKVWQSFHALWRAPYIAIDIARNEQHINWISRQYHEHISLILDDDGLQFQILSWSGWQKLYRKPDPNNPDEKYLALWSEKLPAIRIKNDHLRALAKVCKDYMQAVQTIESKGLSSIY